MRIVVASGKGGTGKTSIVVSFAALAEERAVLADCDVDAADLHFFLEPRVLRRRDFVGSNKARSKRRLGNSAYRPWVACPMTQR